PPLLPRNFYGEYSEQGGLCFLNPGRVKLKMPDGECEIVLNNLKAIASLFSNNNLKTCFSKDSWPEALEETRGEEDPHWVWEDAEPCGYGKCYVEQQDIAREKDRSIYPERYATEAASDVESGSGAIVCSQKQPQIVNMIYLDDYVLGEFL